MIQRQLRVIHRWLGLCLLAPLVVQGLTGVILTLEPQLQPLTAVATAPGEVRPVSEIVAAARALAPPDLRPVRYVAPPRPRTGAEIWFAPSAGRSPRGTHVVRIDPVTLSPLGEAEQAGGELDWLRRLHTNFLAPDYGGRAIVGWVGVGLVLLSLIGIPLWWPRRGRWREAFTVSTRARGVVFQRRLHGAAGIWALVMLLMSGMTGAVLGFPQTVRGIMGLPPGGPPRVSAATPVAPAPAPDLDAAVMLARGTGAGLAVRTIILPAGGGEPIRIFLGPAGTDGAATATVVTTNASGTRVLSQQSPQTLGWAETTLRWAHDLHEGAGLGPLWRGATALSGVVLPLMAVTGATMWLLRRRGRRRIALTDQVPLRSRL
jgi:uncharacterized iron-regulated membrane protein